jgi:uncharacterized membrane protein YfcA
MLTEYKNKKLDRYLILPVISFFAGGVNGFLGTGAGIVLVYLLTYLNRGKSETKNNFAMTIALVIPMSAISLYFYIRGGNVDYELIRISVIPAMLGGILGAYLMDKINRRLLSLIFAVLVIYSGFRMVI